jgi:hypothetical protein
MCAFSLTFQFLFDAHLRSRAECASRAIAAKVIERWALSRMTSGFRAAQRRGTASSFGFLAHPHPPNDLADLVIESSFFETFRNISPFYWNSNCLARRMLRSTVAGAMHSVQFRSLDLNTDKLV